MKAVCMSRKCNGFKWGRVQVEPTDKHLCPECHSAVVWVKKINSPIHVVSKAKNKDYFKTAM